MEEYLLEKLSRITPEEEQLLSGTELDEKLYTGGGDFVVQGEKISSPERDITVRTHTRYANFPLHRHNYLEMMIVLSGKITHTLKDTALTLVPGDILIMNKHVSHSIDRADTEDIGVNVIISDRFADSLLAELSDTVFATLASENSKADGRGMYICFSAGENKQIANIIENMIFELIEYQSDVKILRRTVALLFDYLSLKSDKMLKKANHLPTREEERRKKIIAYIRQNYKTASLQHLASEMYMSAPYLSKLVKEYFGFGFKELLLEERMNRAAELFEKSKLPISEIIEAVGYENQSYFHREFKRAKGTTPLGYRKKSASDR